MEEQLAFIGMNMAMGLLRLPQINDYWYKIPILSTPWFPSIFPVIAFMPFYDSYT